MLNPTDERYIPGYFDLNTANEHIHRYLFASNYVKGKRVLDLACGEGYGSHLLSLTASEVIGIDIYEEAVMHARETYINTRLKFIVGSITAVPLHGCPFFDVIICFEALEHIDEQDKMLLEVKRLLSPNGLFIVSTPNKPVYSEKGQRHNPYHLKELDIDEFKLLMFKHFKGVDFYGQKTYAASKIFPLEKAFATLCDYKIQNRHQKFIFETEEDPLPRYFIAIASKERLASEPSASYLVDTSPREGYVTWCTHQEEAPKTIPFWKKVFRRIYAYLK